jgi:hypothetical protein
MPPSKIFTQYGLFPGADVQVTSGTTKQARSESIVAVNPNNASNLIAASKKFSNPQTYRFTIGVRVSFDGGASWQDATLPTLPAWGDMVGTGGQDATAGMTDPAVVFDQHPMASPGGNAAFMVGEPIAYQPNGQIDTIGMYVYKSIDGGATWGQPTPLHVGDKSDDKSWIACDNNPLSPYYGHVYIAWGASSPLRFARSTDHGAHWKGVGNDAPGSQLANTCFAPEITVGLDGTVHIVWHVDGSTTIEYRRSTDGGDTFEAQKSIVTGVHSLRGNLPEIDQWPHFPGATFRVITLATGCAFGLNPLDKNYDPKAKNFVVAWSDYRENTARIYYRMSSNAGASFDGPANGQPLLAGKSIDPNLHHFHPQLVATGSGVIGCAYYEYGPKGGKNLIDTMLSASFDQGQKFDYTTTVTDKAWDPAIDAPFSHGDANVTFIGEYFGLDADGTCFDVLWTDTRTGVQELFFDRVCTEKYEPPAILGGIVAEVLYGVIQDGGGAVIINGHIIRIPPRGPEFELVQALVALNAAGKISGAAGRALTRSVFDAVGAIARTAGESAHVAKIVSKKGKTTV